MGGKGAIGLGGLIEFNDEAKGGTARVIVNAGATFDILGSFLPTLSIGSIAGDVTTSGAVILAPGASPGKLTIEGDLILSTQTKFIMELGGLIPGSQHDFLMEGGTKPLTPGGTLAVRFIAGFQNSVGSGDTFTIIGSNQTIAGAFSNVASGTRLATADGLGTFLVIYGSGSSPNAVVLSDFLAAGSTASMNLQTIADSVSSPRKFY